MHFIPLLGLLACGNQESSATSPDAPATSQTAPASWQQMDTRELKTRHDAGDLTVLDVRSPAEFASGHMEGAINIPVQALATRVAELEAYRQAPLYVICRTQNRSGVAAQTLTDAGFAQIIQVTGGMAAWQVSGFPMVQ